MVGKVYIREKGAVVPCALGGDGAEKGFLLDHGNREATFFGGDDNEKEGGRGRRKEVRNCCVAVMGRSNDFRGLLYASEFSCDGAKKERNYSVIMKIGRRSCMVAMMETKE